MALCDVVWTVGLLVTYACNLDCRYCYIEKKKEKYMNFETAKEILLPLLQKEGPSLTVMILGGEPLLAFPLIRELVEWTEQSVWKRPVWFFASTNGTLLDEEMKQWFREHADRIALGLSYDGLPECQNHNRTPKKQRIDLGFFRSQWPQQEIQMTVTADSVSQMADGVIYLLEQGFHVHANVAYEQKDWPDESLWEYSHQLERLSVYYREHPQQPLIRQFWHPIGRYVKNLRQPVENGRACGAGDGYFVYDMDGKVYPCHMFSPLVLDSKQLKSREAQISDASIISDSRCFGCPYAEECATCIGCNFRFRGKKQMRDYTHCCIMHIEVRNYLKFLAKQLKAAQSLNRNQQAQWKLLRVLTQWERENGVKYLLPRS